MNVNFINAPQVHRTAFQGKALNHDIVFYQYWQKVWNQVFICHFEVLTTLLPYKMCIGERDRTRDFKTRQM